MASPTQAEFLALLRIYTPDFSDALIREYRENIVASERANQILLARLQRAGFVVQVDTEGRPLLYAEYPGRSEHSLFLYSRCPVGACDNLSVFAPVTVCGSAGGSFYAPGIGQDGGTILAWLVALEFYQQHYGSLPVTVKWLFDGGEPTEVRHLEEFLAGKCEHFNAELCICSGGSFAEDGAPQLELGVKGRLGIKLSVRTAIRRIDLQHGTIVPNAAWRLTWALASLKNVQEEVLIEGFYEDLVLTESAAIETLYTLPDDAGALAVRLGLEQLLLGLQGFQKHYAQRLLPTCTVTHLSCDRDIPVFGGEKAIPKYAEATLDFFLVPGQQPERLFQQIQQHLQLQGFGDFELQQLYGFGSAYTAGNEPGVQRIAHLMELACEREPVILPLSTESLPIASLIQRLQIPLFVVGSSYPGSQTGTALEHIRLSDFEASVRQMALIFHSFEEHQDGSDAPATTERTDPGDSGRG